MPTKQRETTAPPRRFEHLTVGLEGRETAQEGLVSSGQTRVDEACSTGGSSPVAGDHAPTTILPAPKPDRLRALDLFCKAGGASHGLVLAGMEVTGIDIDEQPRYRSGPFVRRDALGMSVDELRSYDFVWASPPCQHSTSYKRRRDHVRPCANLIPQTRELLERAGVPYVIENVEGAREHMRNPWTLCGSMFGLDVRRHRLFESSFPVAAPQCDHAVWSPRFPPATNRKNLRKTVEVGVWRIPMSVQYAAMGGCEWMTTEELSNAIPPAYSEWIARQWLAMRESEPGHE